MRCLLALLLTVPFVLTVGCSSTGVRTVTADETMNGSRVSLRVGAVLTVKLPENPSTGYRWVRTGETGTTLLTELDDTFDRSPAKDGAVGVGGTRVLRYRAERIGDSMLQLDLVPPGRNPDPEDKRYRITVVIAD